jgi:hypothetical protein
VILALCVLMALPAAADARSAAELLAFKRANPCPSTGHRRGACPGYVIDHVDPLCAGGPDHRSNMQWQTVAEGKAKDKWERKGCGK